MNVGQCLAALRRNYLVQRAGGRGTYTLQASVQEHAYSRIPSEGDYSKRTCHALAADYFATQRAVNEDWSTIEDLDSQLDEFRHRKLAEQYDVAARLLDGIDEDYLQRWGHYGKVIEMRSSLDGKLTDTCLIQTNSGSLGTAYHWIGKDKEAIDFLGRALGGIQPCEDATRLPVGTWKALLGRSYARMGRISDAIRLAKEALEASSQSPNSRLGEVHALNVLAVSHRRLGRLCDADGYYERALATTREIGNRYQEARTLNNWGVARLAAGKVQDAKDLCMTALDLATEAGYRLIEACTLDSLGEACLRGRQWDEAEKYYLEAVNRSREIENESNLSYALEGLATIYHHQDKLEGAREYYLKGHSLDVGETRFRIALKLGILYAEQDNPPQSESYLEETKTRSKELLREAPDNYEARYYVAHVTLVTDPKDALATYREALDVCSEKGVIQWALLDLELVKRTSPEQRTFDEVKGLLEEKLASG